MDWTVGAPQGGVQKILVHRSFISVGAASIGCAGDAPYCELHPQPEGVRGDSALYVLAAMSLSSFCFSRPESMASAAVSGTEILVGHRGVHESHESSGTPLKMPGRVRISTIVQLLQFLVFECLYHLHSVLCNTR